VESPKLIFRNDDVSPCTNPYTLSAHYNIIKGLFKDSQILSCVTLFAKHNVLGAVYGDVPFKNQTVPWFYDVDRFMLEYEYMTKDCVVSHGLFHVNHSKLNRDAQEMSILGSCKFLKTNLFCAPFNAVNSDTVDVCQKNNIKIINNMYEWRSLERDPFDPLHKYWYYHSWRMTPDDLRKRLTFNAKLNN